MTPEHRAKISAALKAYRASPHAHKLSIRARWAGGVKPDYYRRVAFEAHGTDCLHCGKPAQIVHHADHDRSNNDAGNLAPLCRSCHMRHHLGVTVEWWCPVCDVVMHMRPFEARIRRFCSRNCKEVSRGSDGRFQTLRA